MVAYTAGDKQVSHLQIFRWDVQIAEERNKKKKTKNSNHKLIHT